MRLMHKKCCRCKKEKPLFEFNRSKNGLLGLHNHCRKCQKEYRREWYLKNHARELRKSSLVSKSAKGKSCRKRRYSKHRERLLEQNRRRRKTPLARAKAQTAWHRRAMRDPSVRLAHNMRVRLRTALSGKRKSRPTLDLLGCDMPFFKKYIEARFYDGMSWENYGVSGWHIDHIRPCSKFNLSDPRQIASCCHYTNLRPLWHHHNKLISNKAGLIMIAAAFATSAHTGQVRKYTGVPYISHPARVAGKFACHPLSTEVGVAAAFSHDIQEDCGITNDQIRGILGEDVATLVNWLTNPSKGQAIPREQRKEIDRKHIAGAPVEACIIKAIDRIDNLLEIPISEPFCDLYAHESRLLAETLSRKLPEDILRELTETIRWMEVSRSYCAMLMQRRKASWNMTDSKHDKISI